MVSKTAEWYKKNGLNGMSDIVGADEKKMREIIELAKTDKDVAKSVARIRRDCPADRLRKVIKVVQTEYGRKVFTRYLISHAIDRMRPYRDKIIEDCNREGKDSTIPLEVWDNIAMPLTATLTATKLCLAIIVASDQCLKENGEDWFDTGY